MTAADDAVRIAEACVVASGDTLVLAVGAHASRQQVDELHRSIEARLPEGVRALVVGGEIHLYVLRSSEAAP